MGRSVKRKNKSFKADKSCSPTKQVKTKHEIISKHESNVGRDEKSRSEENDSDVADVFLNNMKSSRYEFISKGNEKLNSDASNGSEEDDDGDGSDDDDHVVSHNDLIVECIKSESGDESDDFKEVIGSRDKRGDNFKTNINTVSTKIKLTEGKKNSKEKDGSCSTNIKDKNVIYSSDNEGSSDSSSGESEESGDDQDELNTKDTLKVVTDKQKQQTGQKRKNVVKSSDESSGDDSSLNEDGDILKHVEDKEGFDTNSQLKNRGRSLNLKGIDIESDSSDDGSDYSDDESNSNEFVKGKSKSVSKVIQRSNTIQSEKEVNMVKGKMKQPLADRDSSDSSDDGSDDANFRDEGDDEEAEIDESEDEFAAVKKELADIPLEDLMKIKDKLGLKMFNKIMHGGKFEEKKQKVFKRENKNRPMEMSAKRKVPVIRNAMVPKEKVRRDPRFDDLSGEFQDKHFMKNYAFLNDVKQKEKLLVQKKLKKTKDEEKRKELSKLLNRMNQQEQLEQKKRHRMEMEQQWKEKEKQLVKEGKTPYFLKKSDKKKLELAEKFKELQKSGKVDQYMSKKMKKNAQKEKKKLPGRQHQRFM